MKFIKPTLSDIPGDSPNYIMGRSGELVGFNNRKAVWRYGFLTGSEMAEAFNVHTSAFIWIIADHDGEIIDRLNNVLAIELPQEWRNIIEGKGR